MDVIAEVTAQIAVGSQVNAASATKKRFELCLHVSKAHHSRRAPRLELDEQIDVTVSTEVFPQRRAENRKPADAVASTELGERVALSLNAGNDDHGIILPCSRRCSRPKRSSSLVGDRSRPRL